MRVKTSELSGAALDWAVTKAKGYADFVLDAKRFREMHDTGHYNYSTEWAQGGPIIEREGMDLMCADDYWLAGIPFEDDAVQVEGPTPLVAAMRCFVLSRLGESVDIPEELV